MTRYYVCNLAYGYGSWGDEMILDGVLNILGRENCVVASEDPPETRKMHNVAAVNLSDWAGFDWDVFFVGGGGWGFGDMADAVTMRMAAARHEGKQVVVYAAGLRPYADWTKPETRILRDVEMVTVRDETSQQVMREHFGRECAIVTDPSQMMGETKFYLPGRWAGVNVVNDPVALEKIVPWCKEALARGYGLLGLVTIAHKKASELNGHDALTWLADMVGEPIVDEPGPWYDDSLGPRELVGLARNCEVILAMRKHGGWLAKRAGVPHVLVDWYTDYGTTHRLAQSKDAIGGGYFDLHAGEVPTWE